MEKDSYTLMGFLKKIWDFISYIFSFLKSRKENEEAQRKEYMKKIGEELKTSYNSIDKEKEAKKEDDINKRLNDMF